MLNKAKIFWTLMATMAICGNGFAQGEYEDQDSFSNTEFGDEQRPSTEPYMYIAPSADGPEFDEIITLSNLGETENVQHQQDQKQTSTITKGSSYSFVMDELSYFPAAAKDINGDALVAHYKNKYLLMYPDTDSECILKFFKGNLVECTGCNANKFSCE